MKKFLLFAFITTLFVSCSSEPKFELEINIRNNSSLKDKKLIINQKIDGSVVYADTIKIKKDHFLMEIPYKGTALLNISIPQSNIENIMMVAEEGKIELNIEGAKSQFGGTPLNDRLQAFYHGNDSISLLFQQLDIESKSLTAAGPVTPQIREGLGQRRTQLLIDNTNRIIDFIRENVDNQVGEYYFMIHYITFPLEKKMELNSFATDKLKKEFGLK